MVKIRVLVADEQTLPIMGVTEVTLDPQGGAKK